MCKVKDRGRSAILPPPIIVNNSSAAKDKIRRNTQWKLLTGSCHGIMDSLHIVDILNVLLYEFPALDDAFL